MRLRKYISVLIMGLLFATACNEGIDPIRSVSPGPDQDAPVITINSPASGYQIKVPEQVASVTINFEVTDDIEIGSVTVKLNGSEIKKYSEFKDYRRLVDEFEQENITNGDHVLEITATDLEGKTTTATVNFQKVSPYTPKYAGETFYLPFDGDFMEQISFKRAEQVGNPGFAGQGVVGGNSYRGSPDSYLTFPFDDLKSDEFSTTFWYKVNPTPDRGGILSIGSGGEDRQHGFRLFREGSAESQQIKLNVGFGTGESWNDGGNIDATSGEWVHIAITMSQTENVIYFNGAMVRTAVMDGPADWTGCDEITIGSGGETFSYWDHLSDFSFIDELRFFNRVLSDTDIQQIIFGDMPYEPKYEGEVFYMPFEGNFTELVSGEEAAETGSPDFADGKAGKAYAGDTDSYIIFPAGTIKNNEISAVFWYKVNSTADRAGILSIGAEPEDRNQGFRLFREGDAESQRIKLNVGFGTGESWNDGGLIDVTEDEWVHIAISISGEKNIIYFNGEEILSGDMQGAIDWTGCDEITIGSGGETFSYWDHLSDLSLIDELRIFSKALSESEIKAIFDAEK